MQKVRILFFVLIKGKYNRKFRSKLRDELYSSALKKLGEVMIYELILEAKEYLHLCNKKPDQENSLSPEQEDRDLYRYRSAMRKLRL